MRAVGYLRKSVVHQLPDGQRTGGDSWEQQEAAIRRLAETQGVEDLVIHSDWGQSGGAKNDRRRRGWQTVLALIDAKEVDVLLAYDEQRLSRSVLSLLDLYGRCEVAGVKVVTAQGGSVDFQTAAGKLKLTILAGVAQYQRDQSSERAQDLADRRRERGEKLGEPFYGEDPEKHPEQDPAVVLAAYREKGSFEMAARKLNEDGVPAKRGGRWYGRTVGMVVRHQQPGLAESTIKRGSRLVSAHRFGGLLRCFCGGTIRGFATRSRPGQVSYACWRAISAANHARPAATSERYLMMLWMIESTRMLPVVDGVVVGEALTAARERRRRLLPLYETETISKEDLDARYAELTAEIEEMERYDNPATRVIAAEDLVALDNLVADPAAFNAHLRRLWDYVECERVGDDTVGWKMRPVRVKWKDGIPLGPPLASLVERLATDERTVRWFRQAGWLQTPPPPVVETAGAPQRRQARGERGEPAVGP